MTEALEVGAARDVHVFASIDPSRGTHRYGSPSIRDGRMSEDGSHHHTAHWQFIVRILGCNKFGN